MSVTHQGDIIALRQHLFDSIKRLGEKSCPEEIARAKAIADTAQVIVNTAKVEIDYINATGATGGSGFIPLQQAGASEVIEQRPGLTVRRHKLEG